MFFVVGGAWLSQNPFCKRKPKFVSFLNCQDFRRFKEFNMHVAEVLGVLNFIPIKDAEITAPATAFLLVIS